MPSSPLLFAIVILPLMTILKEKDAAGRIQGLEFGPRKLILFQLFANNTRVMLKATQGNFQELQEAIKLYENILGAKLNLFKSIVIPIALKNVPEWLKQTGCHIVKNNEVIRYLVFPIGRGLT